MAKVEAQEPRAKTSTGAMGMTEGQNGSCTTAGHAKNLSKTSHFQHFVAGAPGQLPQGQNALKSRPKKPKRKENKAQWQSLGPGPRAKTLGFRVFTFDRQCGGVM